MSNTRLFFLFQLYTAGQANAEEQAEMMDLLTDPVNEEEANGLLNESWNDFEPKNPVFTTAQSKQILKNVLNTGKNEDRKSTRRLKQIMLIATAAAALLLIPFIAWVLKGSTTQKDQLNARVVTTKKAKHAPDVAPGGDKAVLTLADGTQIALDNVPNGKIESKAGVIFTKTADGQLVCVVDNKNAVAGNNQELVSKINTITTPKGGQYQVSLPDGSKVWLNAASTLKFPTVFSGNERKVELTGEAYFEISSVMVNNAKLPFKVVSYSENGKGQEVEVLGTHFNINAYGNENTTRTTLIEGSVKVTSLQSKDTNVLYPGQQASLRNNNIKIAKVDTEEVMAWKKGNFQFNDLKLVNIMKQLERWYDVEVDYVNIPDTRYNGFISKKVTLSQVLNMLELTGNLKFNIEELQNGAGKIIKIDR